MRRAGRGRAGAGRLAAYPFPGGAQLGLGDPRLVVAAALAGLGKDRSQLLRRRRSQVRVRLDASLAQGRVGCVADALDQLQVVALAAEELVLQGLEAGLVAGRGKLRLGDPVAVVDPTPGRRADDLIQLASSAAASWSKVTMPAARSLVA